MRKKENIPGQSIQGVGRSILTVIARHLFPKDLSRLKQDISVRVFPSRKKKDLPDVHTSTAYKSGSKNIEKVELWLDAKEKDLKNMVNPFVEGTIMTRLSNGHYGIPFYRTKSFTLYAYRPHHGQYKVETLKEKNNKSTKEEEEGR